MKNIPQAYRPSYLWFSPPLILGGSVISAGTIHDLRRVKVPGTGSLWNPCLCKYFFCSSLWQVCKLFAQAYDKYVFFLLKPMTSMLFLLKPMTSMLLIFLLKPMTGMIFFCSSLWQVWFFFVAQVYDRYDFFLLKPMTSMFFFYLCCICFDESAVWCMYISFTLVKM